MAKGLRLSEQWFQRGLWVIAVLFAGFLMGLGSLVVRDLPQVQKPVDAEAFMDQGKLAPVRAAMQANEAKLNDLNAAHERAQQDAEHAEAAYDSEKQSFDNWIQTRSATQQDSQNPEVLARQHKIDALNDGHRKLQAKVEAIETDQTNVQQDQSKLQAQQQTIEDAGQSGYQKAVDRAQLHTFGLRLLITLPLLLLAVYLFVKHRKGPRWPFVWGFIFFALYCFFFELVPYLPSYGGYLRYVVGIVITVWGGNYAIGALRRYLDAQKAQEQRPEEERRRDLGYEGAQMRLAKRVCPACERPLDTADPTANFCVHCGLLVFSPCPRCGTRQTTFSHFCRACGLAKAGVPPEEPLPPAPLTPPGESPAAPPRPAVGGLG